MVRKYIKSALCFLFINVIIFLNHDLTTGCDICGIGCFGGSQGGLTVFCVDALSLAERVTHY